MRQLMAFFLIMINFSAIAQKTIKTIDIINTSDLPLTVTYNVCHMERELRRIVYDSISNKTLYDFGPPQENCVEKQVNISGKNIGMNSIEINATDRIQASKVGEKSIENAVVYVSSIESTLGVQSFISSADDAKKTEGIGSLSRCYGINSDNNGNGGNVIELDNKGTHKIYCQSSYQPN